MYSNKESTLDDLIISKKLGSGGNAKVYLVKDRDEQLYAAKVMMECS